MNPKVSMIFLTFNQEDTVTAALESVLGLDVPPGFLEVVIGEDASGDSTREICRHYVSRFPGLFRLMPSSANKGLVRNYHDCLKECRGEYVIDCAGDDEWLPGADIYGMASWLDMNTDYTAIAADWMEEDLPTGAGHHIVANPPSELIDALPGAGHPRMLLSAMMYRRKIVMEVLRKHPERLMNESFPCEDVPLFVALRSEGLIARWEGAPVYAYRKHAGSVSTPESTAAAYRFTVGVIRCMLSLGSQYGIKKLDMREGLSRRIRYACALRYSMLKKRVGQIFRF